MTDTEATNTAKKTSGSSSSVAQDTEEQPQHQGPVVRALSVVEFLGNKLPDPFWLFVILAGAVVALSALFSSLGMTAVNPADGEEVAIQNLLTPEGAQRMVGEAVENFATFPPLGVVITVLLGVAVAERTGLINTAVKLVVSRVSAGWLTFVLALAGVTGSVASDAIVVVLIPLGAAAFKAAGRSAVLGAVIAFVAAREPDRPVAGRYHAVRGAARGSRVHGLAHCQLLLLGGVRRGVGTDHHCGFRTRAGQVGQAFRNVRARRERSQ